jgi:hypothetical protein
MTLLGFKTILHKKCRSGKNSEGPAENSWVLDPCMSSKMKTNFKKSDRHRFIFIKFLLLFLFLLSNFNK